MAKTVPETKIFDEEYSDYYTKKMRKKVRGPQVFLQNLRIKKKFVKHSQDYFVEAGSLVAVLGCVYGVNFRDCLTSSILK